MPTLTNSIAARIGGSEPLVSFEFFPPRSPAAALAFETELAQLLALSPDYVSVTYGSNGATRDGSRQVVTHMLAQHMPVLAHLTCVATPRQDVREVVRDLLELGVTDILALRGDPPRDGWLPGDDDLRFASDLVVLVRDVAAELRVPVGIAVAAYPGAVAGTFDIGPDVAALRTKQRAGAHFAITQVFFDPGAYVNLVNRARAEDVSIPIVPGILPLTELSRVTRLSRLSGVPIPQHLIDELAAAPSPEEQYQIGLARTVDLARKVLDFGAPGLHIYTFNRARAARDLVNALALR